MIKIQKSQVKNIIADYNNNIEVKEIAKGLNVDITRIYQILKEYRVPKRDFDSRRGVQMNSQMFAAIDSAEKAQILGLWYADGCNYKGQKHSLILSLQLDDLDYIHQICQYINPELIKGLKVKDMAQEKSHWGKKKMCELRINNKKMSDHFNSLGCVPRKSLILRFPTENQVPNEFIKFFIKGYFEGDGSIYSHQRKGKNYPEYHISIVGTLNFCEGIKRVIKNHLNIGGNIYIDKRKSNQLYYIRISGNNQVRKFCQWIYGDRTSILLKRKFLVFKSLISFLDSREREISELENKICVMYRDNKKSGTAISKLLGIDIQRVYGILKKHKTLQVGKKNRPKKILP